MGFISQSARPTGRATLIPAKRDAERKDIDREEDAARSE